jgi:hypothetical protein
MALHYCELAREHYPNVASLRYAQGVALFQLADAAMFYSEKADLWGRAEQKFK